MLKLLLLDEHGAVDASPSTIELRTPGTFPKLRAGMEKWEIVRRAWRDRHGRAATQSEHQELLDNTRSEKLELLIDHVSAWDGILNNGTPVECNRSNVAAYLTAAPWIRRQVEEGVQALQQSGTF